MALGFGEVGNGSQRGVDDDGFTVGFEGESSMRLLPPVLRVMVAALLATWSKYVVEPSCSMRFAASLSCAAMNAGVSFMMISSLFQSLVSSGWCQPVI